MSAAEDEPQDLAAEYVLGTLDLAEMREAEALAARDPAFAADIARWQQRLSPLASLVEPVSPPPLLWSRLALAAGIGAASPRRGGNRGWQVTTGLSLALAACLALFAFLPNQTRQPPRLAAALAPLSSPARFIAQTAADGALVITPLGNSTAPAGRDFELWSLPRGSATPVSLGVLRPGQQVVARPGGTAPQEQLLVSEEPSGGSPTGAPTGPVVLGGTLVPLPAPAR